MCGEEGAGQQLRKATMARIDATHVLQCYGADPVTHTLLNLLATSIAAYPDRPLELGRGAHILNAER